MLKGFSARRRQRMKRKLAAQKNSKLKLQTESLEERALLAVTAAGFQAGSATISEATSPFPLTDPGLKINFQTNGIGADTISFAIPSGISGASNAEASDYTLTSLTYPAGTLAPGVYTVVLDGSSAGGLLAGQGLQLINDSFVEGTEKLDVTIAAGIPLLAGTVKGTVIDITDTESATVQIDPMASVSEPGGAQTFAVTLDLSTTDGGTPTLTLEDSYAATINQIATGTTAQNSSGTNPDYVTFPSGGLPVSFGAGAGDGSVVNVPLTTIDDVLIEGDEFVGFSITPATPTTPPAAGSANNYTATTSPGTVKITDDDVAYITFVDSLGNPYASDMEVETAATGDTKVFAKLNLPSGATLSAPLNFDVDIDLSAANAAEYGSFTSPGGALGDGDFTLAAPTGYSATMLTDTHTFPVGSTDGATILFDLDHESGPYDDNYLEGDEVVSLVIKNLMSGTTSIPNNAPTGLPTTFDLTIKDNETGTVAITQTNSPVTEGQTTAGTPGIGANTLDFQITVTPTGLAQFPIGGAGGAGSFPVPVSYGGTASNWAVSGTNPVPTGPSVGAQPGYGTGAADYDASAFGSIVVDGTGTATWSVPVITDLALESTETVIATIPGTLSALGGITASTASATAEILDDDVADLVIEFTANPTGDGFVTEGATTIDPDDNCDGDPNGPSTAPGAMGPGCGNIYVNDALNDFTDDDADFLVSLIGPGGVYVVADSTTVANLDRIDSGSGISTTASLSDFTINGVAATSTLAVSIAAGSPFAHVNVNDVDDNIVEATENADYDFNTSSPTSAYSGDADITPLTTTGAYIDILDNDQAKLRIRAGDPLAAEATPADTGNFVFELVDGIGNPITTSMPITVNFQLLAGSAGLGVDYNLFAIGGLSPSQPLNPSPTPTVLSVTSLTIPAGQSSVGVLVVPVDDTILAEGLETVNLEFTSAAIPAALGPGIGPGMIQDCSTAGAGTTQSDTVNIGDNDGNPEVSITTADMTANEDHVVAGGNLVEYTISIPAPAPTAVSGTLSYTNGADVNTILPTMPPTTDYEIFAPGVPVVAGTGVAPTHSSAVNYTIPAGMTSVTFTLRAIDDNVVEDLETVDIKVETATGSSAVVSSANQIQAKINDTDKGTIKVEGILNTDESGTQVGVFDFNIDTSPGATPNMGSDPDTGGTSDTATTISFTLGGTASSPEYTVYLAPTFGTASPVVLTPTAGVYTITLPAGATTASIQVVGNDDALLEGAESIIATLTNAVGDADVTHATTTTPAAIAPLPTTPSVQPAATNGAGNATIWILDDDAASVRVTATDPFAAEDNSAVSPNPAAFLFEINLPASSVAANVTLAYAATAGAPGATPGTDVDIAATGTVTIPAGSNSVVLPVNVLNDLISEGDEFLNVAISGISVPGLLGMTIDTTARVGAGTTSPPVGDCYSTFCSAFYNSDNMVISDDDVGEAWLYRSTDIINFPWNTVEETTQKANFFVQLTNPTTTPQTIRFSMGGTTPVAFGTPDAEFNYQSPANGVLTVDLGSTNPLLGGVGGPGGGVVNTVMTGPPIFAPVFGSGLSVGPTTPGLVLVPANVYSGTNINPATGREEYDVTLPAGQQVAHIQVTSVDDFIVEGTENIDIDLEPASNQPGLSSFYSPSNTVNNATLYITESDKATVSYDVDAIPPANQTDTELTLSPEGTGTAQPPGIITLSVPEQIEGTLTVNYGQMDVTTTAADYTVGYGVTPSSVSGAGGVFVLTNTVGFTAPIQVTATPDAMTEADEKLKIVTTSAVHNNPGVTPITGLTFLGGQADTTDTGVVEIIDDDIVSLTTSPTVAEVDSPTPGVVPAAAANTTKTTATIAVKAGTPAGTINYTTMDIAHSTGTTDAARSTTASPAGLDSGQYDYVPVSGTAFWDGNNFCTNAAVPCASGNVIGTTFSFDVTVNGDNVVEGDQTFNVELTHGSGLGIVFSPIMNPVQIIDNDTATISILNDMVTEPVGAPAGAATPVAVLPHNINFVSDKAIEGTLRLDAAVAAGNGLGIPALVGAVIDPDNTSRSDDYSGPSGSNASSTNLATPGDVIWTNTGAGASGSITLPVEIHSDLLIEADESINVHYSNVTHTGVNTSWTAPYATGPSSLSDEVLIKDIDTAVFDVTSPLPITEGASAVVTVSMVAAPNHTLQQNLQFLLGSTDGPGIGGAFSTTMPAIQPTVSDYTNTPPTVTFAAGAGNGATASGAFATNDDNIIEATETFTVNASPFPGIPTTYNFSASIPSANAANISSGTTGTVTINDNDSAKVVITSTDGAEGVSDGSFTFTLQDETTGALKVTDEDTFIQLVVSGSAVRGTDYVFSDPAGVIVPPSGPSSPTTLFVRIPAGESSVTIGVDITDDATSEALENIVLTVGAVNNTPFPRNITFICSTTGAPSSGQSNIAASDGGGSSSPFTPSNIFISGSSWAAGQQPYQLTNNLAHSGASGFHGRTLPWAHLNTVTVTYSGMAPTAGDLVLSDATLSTTFTGASGGTATWTVSDPFNPLAFLVAGVTNQIGVKNDLTITAGGALSVTTDIVPGDIDASFTTDIGDILGWISFLGAATSGTAPNFSDVDGSGLTDVGDVNAIILSNGAASTPLAAPIDEAFADNSVRSLDLGVRTVDEEVALPTENRVNRFRGRNLERRIGTSVVAEQANESASVDDAFASLDDEGFRFSQF